MGVNCDKVGRVGGGSARIKAGHAGRGLRYIVVQWLGGDIKITSGSGGCSWRCAQVRRVCVLIQVCLEPKLSVLFC